MPYPMDKKAEELVNDEKMLIKAREAALESIRIAKMDLELVDQHLENAREKMRKAGIVVENG